MAPVELSVEAATPFGMVADVTQFSKAGEAVLSGDLTVYSDPWIQAGPLQLVSDATLVRLFGGSYLSWGILEFLVMWVLLLTAALLARPSGSPRKARIAGLLFAAFVAASNMAFSYYSWGHWWHAVVFLLLAAAARLAAEGRWVWAGALIGACMWFEPFAALGIGVLAVSPDWFRAARSAVIAAAVGVSVYLPFAVPGPFALGAKTWPVQRGTWASVVITDSSTFAFTWSMRLAQAAACVLLSAGVIWACRRLPLPSLALVAAAAVGLARLVTEAFWLPYYWTMPFILIVGAAMRLLWLHDPATIPLMLAAWMGSIVYMFSGPLAAFLVLALLATSAAQFWATLWRALSRQLQEERRLRPG
jgi:hypothetical protein